MTVSAFIINVEDIHEDGFHITFDDASSCQGFEADLPGDMSLSGPLKAQADFFREDRYVHLSGKVEGVLLLKCHRCLEECSEKISREFYYMLQPAENDDAVDIREVSLGADDLDVWNYNNGMIRLDEIFREQLLLQIPLKTLCSEECRGICPGCGRNLNEEKCCCSTVASDGPFAALRALKTQEG